MTRDFYKFASFGPFTPRAVAMMGGGLVQIVTGRFLCLMWHAIVTIMLFVGKDPGIQIEVDPGLSADQRRQQFADIDTW